MSIGESINTFYLTLEVAFQLAAMSIIFGAILGVFVLGYYAANTNQPYCLRFSSQLPEAIGLGATAIMAFAGVTVSQDEFKGFILTVTAICCPFVVGIPIYYLRTYLKNM